MFDHRSPRFKGDGPITASDLAPAIPERGLGEAEAFALLEEMVRERSAQLGAPDALAHMDPAPDALSVRLVGLNAGVNQNLLHPDLSPFATEAERRVIGWLTPFFGMQAGHMCAGSTIANLAALWCAREHGATRVVSSADAHISVPKAARILGLPYEAVPVDAAGRMALDRLPSLDGAALVLTAGTTGRGVVDDLSAGIDMAKAGRAAWVHVDAAWAGPLRLTRYSARLDGIARAQSVAVSAHKWLFQPKDSAMVLFADPDAQRAISFGGAYLAVPNIGVQGSRGAAGVALLGTLLAWGRTGLADRIERCMALSEALADRLDADPRVELRQRPETAVLNWRPVGRRGASRDAKEIIARLGPAGSRTEIDGQTWVRQVAANLHAELDRVWARIDEALG